MSEHPHRLPPPPGVDPALFTYLQNSFAGLSGQMETGVRLSRRALELGEENAASITRLNWHVFGSKPPPGAPGPGAPHPAALITLPKRVTGTEHEAAAAEGREIARDARLARIEQAMGIAPEGAEKPERRRAFLHSAAGRSFLLKLATLILAATTPILLAVLAARGGAAPSPSPSPPPAAAVSPSEGVKR